MNGKLKIALRLRSNEQGFAMPIVIGLGLIMTLVAITMIVRSQGDQVTASAQKATTQSLGTTETGITRVQSLLNRYRILSNISLRNVGTTSSSWKQVYVDTPTPACTTAGTVTDVDGYRLSTWIPLGTEGKFRINDYTYKPTSAAAQIIGGVVIPASGPTLPFANISPNPYLANGDSVDGQIQGIQGTLSRSGSTYTFKRSISGTATSTTENFLPMSTPGTATLKLESQLSTAIQTTNSL